jgi:hypothetical protein
MDITSYIESTRRAGYDDPSIRSGLERSGLKRSEIDSAFASLGGFVDLYMDNGAITIPWLFSRRFVPYMLIIVAGSSLLGSAFQASRTGGAAASSAAPAQVAISTQSSAVPIASPTAAGSRDTLVQPATTAHSSSATLASVVCDTVSLTDTASAPRDSKGMIVPYNGCFNQAYQTCAPATQSLATSSQVYTLAVASTSAGTCSLSVTDTSGKTRDCPVIPAGVLLDQLLSGC